MNMKEEEIISYELGASLSQWLLQHLSSSCMCVDWQAFFDLSFCPMFFLTDNFSIIPSDLMIHSSYMHSKTILLSALIFWLLICALLLVSFQSHPHNYILPHSHGILYAVMMGSVGFLTFVKQHLKVMCCLWDCPNLWILHRERGSSWQIYPPVHNKVCGAKTELCELANGCWWHDGSIF